MGRVRLARMLGTTVPEEKQRYEQGRKDEEGPEGRPRESLC